MIIMVRKNGIIRMVLMTAAAVLFVAAVFAGIDAAKNKTVSTISDGNWGLSFQEEGQPPVANATAEELAGYNAFYADDTDEKVMYITFDAGYENGYTEKILDVLKKHQVKAAFFLVGNYIETSPEPVSYTHLMAMCHGDSEHVKIVRKEDKPGIDVYVDGDADGEEVHIPVVVEASGFTDKVYNDFHIADGANVVIIAGCGIHNDGHEASQHDGVHAFHVGKGANVTYKENHYGEGSGDGARILNPVTEIYMDDDLSLIHI